MILFVNFVRFFIPLSLFVWALFMPHIAGYIYIVIYGLFEGYLFLIDKIKKDISSEEWSNEEVDIIRKYYLALRFPLGAKNMSVFLNGFRVSGILWAILFLFNQMWFPVVFVVVSFFITASLSVRLDPFLFLGQAVASGKIQYIYELKSLQKVSEKLMKLRRDRFANEE